MHVAAHFGSCKSAGLIRRINREQEQIAQDTQWFDNIEVVLPEDYEGDRNVNFRDVLADKVPYARLFLGGSVVSKKKVKAMLAETNDITRESKAVIEECRRKLNGMGVKVK